MIFFIEGSALVREDNIISRFFKDSLGEGAAPPLS
jgi:hypothetical protein